MKTLDDIRNDLKEIRYYYSRKTMFDRMGAIVESDVVKTVNHYNSVIRSAPAMLRIRIQQYAGSRCRRLGYIVLLCTQSSREAIAIFAGKYKRRQQYMIDDFIEQLKKATNVYRTEQHIVVQSFGVQFNKTYGSVTVSYDTYYPRTEELDDLFEEIHSERHRIDGKRLHSTMYVRKYVYY